MVIYASNPTTIFTSQSFPYCCQRRSTNCYSCGARTYTKLAAISQVSMLIMVAKGNLALQAYLPAERELGTTGFEEAQVEQGGKWSPVKTCRRSFPKGAAGNIWARQATLLRRTFEPPLTQPLRVVVAVTLRFLDGNPNVYEKGRRLLAATNWLNPDIAARIAVSVRA